MDDLTFSIQVSELSYLVHALKRIRTDNYRKNGQPPGALIIRDLTLDAAKRTADHTVKESIHACDAACSDW